MAPEDEPEPHAGTESADDEEAADSEESLSPEERNALEADLLPERAAMSTLGADVTVPIDPAIVADVLAGAEPPESTDDEPDAPADETDDDPGEKPE